MLSGVHGTSRENYLISYDVDPETVGQSPDGKHHTGDLFKQASGVQELIWDEKFCKFCLRNVVADEYGMLEIHPFAPHTLSLNLIGNIHDNPELLEE